jgi:hypothetical protein
LIIFHPQIAGLLMVRVSVIEEAPSARVPEPRVPPVPIVKLLPFVARVPLLMLIEDGVKISVEPDALLMVAVLDPDTVIEPVMVMSPSKVVVYPVSKVHGFGTVIADDAVRVPPAPVSMASGDPNAGAAFTVRLLLRLSTMPPENVLLPERLTAPVRLSVPVLPDKSSIVPAKVDDVEVTESIPSRAIVPVVGLSVVTLIVEAALRLRVTPLSMVSVVKLKVVLLLFIISAVLPEEPLIVADPKENVEQEKLLQVKVVAGAEEAFVAIKTQGFDVAVNVVRAELTVPLLLVTVPLPKAEVESMTRVPLSKKRPPEKVLTPLKVRDAEGYRSITRDPDPGDRSPITPVKELELVDAMVNVPSTSSFPVPEPKVPIKVTGSPELASIPSVVPETTLREERFKVEEVLLVISAKPLTTPLGI